MANYEATKYDFDGANLTGIEGIPTATIVPWSDSSIPSGFLECNGAAVSRTTYADLFAIVSTTYGSGDGSSTFNVPDLQDKVMLSKSNNKALGSSGGADTVQSTGNVGGATANATLTEDQLASHDHDAAKYQSRPNLQPGVPAYNYPDTSPYYNTQIFNPRFNMTFNAGSTQGHAHNMAANFTGDATSVVQPYLTVIYVIKT